MRLKVLLAMVFAVVLSGYVWAAEGDSMAAAAGKTDDTTMNQQVNAVKGSEDSTTMNAMLKQEEVTDEGTADYKEDTQEEKGSDADSGMMMKK